MNGVNLAERFAAYASAFEETYADDDWSRLRAFFTDDAVYETVGDDGKQTRFEGLDAVLDGLKNAVDTFDRRFATRRVDLRGELEVGDGTVRFAWDAEYTTPGAPALHMGGLEDVLYDGDRIRHLRDVFDRGTSETIGAWMAEHAGKLSATRG